MTVLQTTDGRLLRRARPAGAFTTASSGPYPPLWSDGERKEHTAGLPAGATRMVSFSTIYSTQPVVAAVVNKLVRQLSTIPLKVYRLTAGGDRERVRDHPLETLLRRPAPRRGPVHLKQWMTLPTLIHGNSLIAKYRMDPEGPPTELIPLDWRHLSAWATHGGPVEFWQTTQTGQTRYINVGETVHFAWESPNGEIGVSPLEQLGVSVRLEDAAQRFATASFWNSARPSGALVLPEGQVLTPDQREELRAQIKAMHGGVDNAFRVALLTGGMDWKPMSFSAQEAELINARELNRAEICFVYDVKPTVIGDLTHGTYSNVEELNKDLFKTTLRPWAAMIEEVIQAQLIDPEPEWAGLFVEFDLNEQLKGDIERRAPALRGYVEAGIMTRNEARKIENLPSLDGGDELMFPANNQAPLADAVTDADRQDPNPLP